MIDAHSAGSRGCRDAMAVLWDYLDGELSSEREAAMRRHLEACRPCLAHLEFERAFLDAVASARTTDQAPPGLRARVTDMLRAEGLLS